MSASPEQAHWERVYTEREPREVSWYEPEPEHSLRLIESAGIPRDAPILDAGGGTSALAMRLVGLGYTDVTVADISAPALARAREAFGDDATRVTWVEADLRDHDFGRRFALWHDRAALHFMVEPGDRDGYLRTLRRSLEPGGQVILACFAPAGPERCSGLPVVRYDAAGLAILLGPEFALAESEEYTHVTPGGTGQAFTFARMEREPGPADPSATGVESLLAEARSKLERLSPADALAATERGDLLIDIRSESQRREDGELPGAHAVARNVLEWRLDPAGPHRDPQLARRDVRVILVCDEGYQSSLAAATLRDFGLDATDVEGGAQAWLAAGLPTLRDGLGSRPGE
jgi:rhodanese-related sulfurtransferase